MRDCYVVSRYSSMSIDPYCVKLDIEEFLEFKNELDSEWNDGERWTVHKVKLRGEL